MNTSDGMTEVRRAIERLHAELVALGSGPMSVPPARLGRARLRLNLDLVAGEGGGQGWKVSGNGAGHVLELEWILGTANDAGTDAAPVSVPPEPALQEALESVFGPPGFDSAARATVFSELAAEAGAEVSLRIVQAAERGLPGPDPEIERGRHRLQRLLERGPAGSTQGAVLLRRVLERHPLESILECLGRGWRYGTGHPTATDAGRPG